MKGAGDIIFHNVESQWKSTPSYCDFSRFYSLLFAARISEASMGRAEVRGHNIINTRLSRVRQMERGAGNIIF
jgi:hypothetical protein